MNAFISANKEARAPFSDGLLRAKPSELDVDASRIIAFLDDVTDAGLDLHGFMLHRRGRVVAEGWSWPYGQDRPRVLHSVAKSFTACAIGLMLAERRFSLDDKVVSFFPEALPAHVDDKLAAMTIENLLTMRTGHDVATSGAKWRLVETSWIAEFFRIPVIHRPGTTYLYTSAASYMLSAIVTRVTGETLHDYLKPRLLEPIGMSGESWDIGPDGVNPGGNGLTARTADMLKLGILHAQHGVWQGRQILPAEWVASATRAHGPGGSTYGYHWAIKPRGAFSALGVFGQMAIVFPSHGAVLAITSAIGHSSELMPHVERHFPQALLGADKDGGDADARLVARLTSMRRIRPMTSVALPGERPVGIRRYRITSNAAGVREIAFEFASEHCTVRLEDGTGTHRITVRLDGWLEGRTDMPGWDLHHGYALSEAPVVAGARWLGPTTFEMTWIFVETAFCDTVRCEFDGNLLRYRRSVNVNSGRLDQEELAGELIH